MAEHFIEIDPPAGRPISRRLKVAMGFTLPGRLMNAGLIEALILRRWSDYSAVRQAVTATERHARVLVFRRESIVVRA